MVGIKSHRDGSAARLAESVKAGDLRLKPFRQRRYQFLKQFVGPYYGGTDYREWMDTPEAEPLNTLYSFVRVLAPNLMQPELAVQVETKIPQLRYQAQLLSERLNDLLSEIRFAEVARRVVRDSMFGPGIFKTGVEHRQESNWLQDPGLPFVDRVDFDRFVMDPNARLFEAAHWVGDVFDMPLDDAYQAGFDRSELDAMSATHHDAFGGSGESAAEKLSRERGKSLAEAFVPQVRLTNVYLRRENVMVVLPGTGNDATDYLAEVPWDGEEGGPYEMIGYEYPPDNAVPIPPMSVVYDLHILMNTLARKIKRQAEREKEIGLYNYDAAKDAEEVRDSGDGELVGVSDVNEFKKEKFGGVDSRSYEPVAFFERWQSQVAGNLSVAGGLRSMADTASQEQQLLGQASVPINEARWVVKTAMEHRCTALARYLWDNTHPAMERQMMVSLPGGEEIPVVWHASEREGRFEDYRFSINLVAMQPKGPEQTYQTMMEILKGAVLPLAGSAQAQGYVPNVSQITTELAEARGLSTADRWWAPVPQQQPQPGEGPTIRNTENNTVNMGRPASREMPLASSGAPEAEGP